MPTDAPALPSIAIIGAGSMGGAILQGLVRSGLATSGVTVTNRTRAKAEALADLDGVTSLALEERPDGNAEAAASARIVLIGVKPAMVPTCCANSPLISHREPSSSASLRVSRSRRSSRSSAPTWPCCDRCPTPRRSSDWR